MEAKAVDGVGWLSVFVVPDDVMAARSKLNANLVFSAGRDVNIKQRIGIPIRNHFVVSRGQFADGFVLRNVDKMEVVLRQIVRQSRLFLFHFAFNDRVIGSCFHYFLPMVLQCFTDFVFLRENQYAGCVFVQTVDDIDAVARVERRIVIGNQAIGGLPFFAVGGDGKEARWFVDDDDVLVFIDDRKVLAFLLYDAVFGDGYNVLGNEGIVILRNGNAADGHLMMGQ